MPNKKPVMNATQVQKKEFNYLLGNVSLNFILRTDVKTEMKSFLEILEQATTEVQAELDKLK